MDVKAGASPRFEILSVTVRGSTERGGSGVLLTRCGKEAEGEVSGYDG